MGDIVKKALIPTLGAVQLGAGALTANPALLMSGGTTLAGGLANDFSGPGTPPKLALNAPSFSASPNIGGASLPDLLAGAGGGVSTFGGAGSTMGGTSSDAIQSAMMQVLSQFGGMPSADPFASYGG